MKLIATAAIALALSETSIGAEPDLQITRVGTCPTQSAPAENFTGNAKVEMLLVPTGQVQAGAGRVTFAPGARTAWHTHPLGQTLIVAEGVGRVQRWGGAVEEIRVGDVVQIPPNVKHWHGASPDSAMTHIAITERQDGKTVDWLEKVTDEQYSAGGAQPAPHAPASLPSTAQRLMGDIAPKLAQLTDDVLFGDVWARPGLSPRDRSLVTVSALVAMNRPEQLRSHLALARKNGVTDPELVEAITQLAFYAGWPNAVTAVSVAREVFQPKPAQ